jgi:formylglycine-generating enzyme required for sulfatase activity
MKARDLLLGIGVVASVCGAAAPRPPMIRIPAGTAQSLYGPPATVSSFAIDRDAVTREEYLSWRAGRTVSVTHPRAPMTNVTRAEARNFCAARGKRLPTAAEWEYVAMASRSSRDGSSDPKFLQALVSSYATRQADRPVDSADANIYGVRGMHDLVWEWVGDLHAHHGATHDLGCAGAALDATDPRNYPAFLRAALRAGLTDDTRLPTLGFRCAA